MGQVHGRGLVESTDEGQPRPCRRVGSSGEGQPRPYRRVGSSDEGQPRPYRRVGSSGEGQPRPCRRVGSSGEGQPRPYRHTPLVFCVRNSLRKIFPTSDFGRLWRNSRILGRL